MSDNDTILEMKHRRGEIYQERRELFDRHCNPGIVTPESRDANAKFVDLKNESDKLAERIRMAESLEEEGAALAVIDKRKTKSPPIHDPYGDDRSAPQDAEEWRDENGTRIAVAGRGASYADEIRRITGATRNPEQPRIGDVIRSIVTGQPTEGRAATMGVATYAGYTADKEMFAEIIDLARNQSRVAQAGARFVHMSASEMSVVKVDSDPTAAWVGEGATIAESSATFGRLNFRARKLATIIRISRELAEDAPNARQLFEQQLGAVIGLELDRVALLGDADGEEPTGIFNTPGITEQTSVGSPTYDDWLDAVKAIEDNNGMPNATIYSPNTKLTLSKLKDSNGSYLSPPTGFTALGQHTTKQIADTQAVVGAFDNLLIGTRSQVVIERSSEEGTSFEKDLIALKITWRGDVQLARPNHFTTLTGIS